MSNSYNPVDYSPPGFSVHGISQARILERVAISFSRGSSQPRDGTHVSSISCIGRQSLHHWTPGKCLPSHNCIKEELGFPGSSVVENPPTKAGDARDVGSIPGLGRSPGGGHGNPLEYFCLENPMDGGAWWATI